MRRALLALLLFLGGGCPGSSDCPRSEAGIRTIQVKGRVVDFETCLTSSGCQGVANVRVSLFYNSAVISDDTAPNGTFAINGVPDGARNYLYVTDSGQGGTYLSSLQAEPITAQGADIFGLELFVLRRNGGLYAGISAEAGVDIQSHPLYLGQVFRVDDGVMKAIPDVKVGTIPASTIRYVNCIPTFQQCQGQSTLFDTRESTGVFGEFVAIGASEGEHAIWAEAANFSVGTRMAPLGRGYVTVGTHDAVESASSQGDGGP